jgi:hypothetical protein
MLRINFPKKYARDERALEPTSNTFASQSIYYPDRPLTKWQEVALGETINTNTTFESPSNKDGPLKICIIGSGAAGLSLATEVSFLAERSLVTNGVELTQMYYDEEVENDTTGLVKYETKWGRIFNVKAGENAQEIGCMRFPTIAVLTWTYINSILKEGEKDKPLKKFPNPGKVLTQFLYRDMDVIFQNSFDPLLIPYPDLESDYINADCNTKEQQDNYALMQDVTSGIINYLFTAKSFKTTSPGYVPAFGELGDSNYLEPIPEGSMTDINALYFARVLVNFKGGKAAIEEWDEYIKEKLWGLWNAYAALGDIPLIDMVNEGIDGLGIQFTAQRDRTYYVELFGRFGFGTGGFRPLNNVTLTEIARLLIWNYSDEYLLPLGENSEFSKGLKAKVVERFSKSGYPNKYTPLERRKALFVGEIKEGDTGKYLGTDVLSIQSGKENFEINTFDYVFIATSHHAAQRLLEPYSNIDVGVVSRAKEFIPAQSNLMFEFEGNLLEYPTVSAYYNPLDKVKGSTGNMYAALKSLHMMRSTKYFTDVPLQTYNSTCPYFVRKTNGNNGTEAYGPIKMVISDTDCATSYFLPPSTDNSSESINALISYTWGDEASNESTQLHGLTKVAGSNSNTILAARHAEITSRYGVETGRENQAGEPLQPNFWLGNMLQAVAKYPEQATKGYMYNWSADRDSRGGFKLDWAGETEMCIQLANHYKTSNKDSTGNAVDRPYLFVAGDSMSHLGGWLEGAFMSSIAAFTGMLVSLKGVDGLSPAGLTLFKDPIKYDPPK